MCTKCSRSRVKFTMKKWRVSNENEKWSSCGASGAGGAGDVLVNCIYAAELTIVIVVSFPLFFFFVNVFVSSDQTTFEGSAAWSFCIHGFHANENENNRG